MPTSRKPYSQRPIWQRWYQDFMDWLWFGPLTRDVRWRYPTYYPSRFKVACSLPADFCRFVWPRLWQRLKRHHS